MDYGDCLDHGLGFKQYRTFSNGKIIVTLFMDAALVVTASTAFKFTNDGSNSVDTISSFGNQYLFSNHSTL